MNAIQVLADEESNPVQNNMGLILPAGIQNQLQRTGLQNLPANIEDQLDRSDSGLQHTTLNSQAADRAAEFQV